METIAEQYLKKYLPQKEIGRRLPASIGISEAWPQIQEERQKRSKDLPLKAADGRSFWWVPTQRILGLTEGIGAVSDDVPDRSPVGTANALYEEAYYSSVIEGAVSGKDAAMHLLQQKRQPTTKSEQMICNDHESLVYVLHNLNGPMDEDFIRDIHARILRDAGDDVSLDWRKDNVYVMSQYGEIIFIPPDPDMVPGMMRALAAFLASGETHPLVKACMAHMYFVYVHPFGDGNGRTARALSFALLLRAGYDCFRSFPISGLVCTGRAKYYRAIKAVEEDDWDMTYFIEYYLGILCQGLEDFHALH